MESTEVSLIDEQIKKKWYTYTIEQHSVIKRDNSVICDNIDAPEEHYAE